MFVDLGVGNLVEAVGGRRSDRRQIGREVATRIARFQARGVRRGDRVFLHFGNRLEFFAELLALWRLGACAVPVDARLTPFEVRTLVSAATPRLAVVDDATDGRVAQALIDAGVGVVGTTETGTVEATAAASRLDDDALILFTSGSTGEPKGVLHTHRSLRARWISLREALGTAARRQPATRALRLVAAVGEHLGGHPPVGGRASGVQCLRHHRDGELGRARWWLLDGIPRTSRGKINRESVRAACSDRSPLDLDRILQRE